MKIKHIYRYITLGLLGVILLTSCDKDFLDRSPKNQFAEDDVWSQLPMMEQFVNDIYWNVGHSFDRPMMSVFTDETMFDPGSDQGHGNVVKSLITPSDYLVFDTWSRTSKMRWEHHYKYIRACNVFLEQVENNEYEDQEFKNRLIGEVHFLRAYHYHNLVFQYGGVPLITKSYELTDDFLLARNTFEECIDFIVEECEKGAELLPEMHEGSNLGRATKGAAMSLKSRVLLYAASELYNSDAAWAQGYSNPELVGYVGGSQTDRLKLAKDAAKAVMDMGIYSLYKGEPSENDSLARNYDEVFTLKQTQEDIFIRNFTESGQIWSLNIGVQNLPTGYKGWGNMAPINGMVDDFEMATGEQFDWDNPEHRAEPYKNRDPRFYVNIFFDGAQWRQRPEDVVAADPYGIIQTGSYEQPDGTWVGGLDSFDTPVTTWSGTHTGYYFRKFHDISIEAPKVRTTTPWRFIRYAEILLNYAEACAELGEYGEARTYTNMLRKRVGMPDLTQADADLVDAVRHERKIELMGEDQRFFDIRRWMIAPEVMQNAFGVDIKYHLNEERPRYNIIQVQEREWKDRFYFFPIKLEELNKNELLIQNPLY
ncbi:RagB/SusD family nutrient uptake outer membrane protein [Zobellia galactanivorans]|uniref:RagB/SusD family nutrient uptake outer membrane protein n=1 Tax=Zobellia galactanivorans (strain DSM 12802 / CCUG 47099 / CIP 106680 / NCIMB 13871 / Dsij) TaxID=63186 RepID=UPI0026E39CC7|nr:RagB/SusD family nutrient uptake outer membrane protein [Zobellia galactanivorans]MDO6807710.1 RagB/SusD family nutrient uptake outer membrane protein [Zobellia galactanivorans]